MGLRVLTTESALDAVSKALRTGIAPDSGSLIPASLRRAASVKCPCAPSALIEAVWAVLHPLTPLERESVAETLDTLIAAGDLVEATEERSGRRHRMIHLGLPRYVRRQSGDIVVFGTRPDKLPLIGESLQDRVSQSAHLRRIVAADNQVPALLDAYGLDEVLDAQWIGLPPIASERELVDSYRSELMKRPASAVSDNFRILDPNSSPDHYRSRWKSADVSDSGVFVGRRQQRYGSDLWCLVELQSDRSVRLLDLPLDPSEGLRGCDEAWRLQAAIDAVNGNPQVLQVRGTGRGNVRLGLPSPPPKWLQRRWDLLGLPVRVPWALFAYEFARAEVREEAAFVADYMWMSRRTDREHTSSG